MRKIGIGYENYKEFIDQELYFVDKTLLIRDIIEKGGKVTLFTRPRRFGKTLALSMLRTFFEAELDRDGHPVDNSRYFTGMKIMDCEKQILSGMGKYPVINLSLKSAKQPDFYGAFLKLREEIVREFGRHEYILQSDRISESDRDAFLKLYNAETEWWERSRGFKSREEEENELRKESAFFATALKTLSTCLKQYHGTNVVILLDEYDVPLENAYFSGFYDEMVSFIRSLFESALKTNDALELAVVMGCLRISRESIFTGLNHLEIYSVRKSGFGEYFGFTQGETTQMLDDYGIAQKGEEVQRWYDGYLFGEVEVYNPWSVTKYVKDHISDLNAFPEPYWSNTSSNAIIKELVEQASEDQKRELDTLIYGGTIEKRIHEDITYEDIRESEDSLWNFLFFTGYMKKVSERLEGEDIYLTMCIPNAEIRYIYDNQISSWFDKLVRNTNKDDLHRAVLNKDTEEMSRIINELLRKTISTFDSKESFYHGFLVSLLAAIPDYECRSNRESGNGRPDIILYPEEPKALAMIFEIKVRKAFNQMEDGVKEACDQIRKQRYAEGVLEEGYAGVAAYGVCFCRKSCIIESCSP